MMRKKITRSLTKATIHAYAIDIVDGKPTIVQLDPVTAWGNLTEVEALKAIKAQYGKATAATISDITYEEEIYQIDIATFVKYATKVSSEALDEED